MGASRAGAEWVISRHRGGLPHATHEDHPPCRLGTLAELFHNLRATRQTELEESFPSHVVCAWIGNSPKVAKEHDRQVTDDHFAKAVQNPVQQPAETARNGRKWCWPEITKPPFCRGLRKIANARRVIMWRIGDLNP